MKKFSLCFFVGLGLSILSVKCQEYVPLVDTSAIWYIAEKSYPPGPMPAYAWYLRYHISGDTILDQIEYRKLFMVNMDVLCSVIIYDSLFVGGIREDTGTRKVYIYGELFPDEMLLYDFTLEVGDTVPITYNNYGYPEMYVSLIDSVLCTDGYRKRYFYSRDTWGEIEVIEGIGAYTGLIEPMVIFEHITLLRCYYHNDSMIYIHPWIDECKLETDTCLPVGLQDKKSLPDNILVYPNPVTDHVFIKNAPSELTVKFYDSMGRLVSTQTTKEQDNSLDISYLKNGLYFLMVYDEDRLVVNKKIIKII